MSPKPWTPVDHLSEQLAILLGQHPLFDGDQLRAQMDADDCDFYAVSSNGEHLYPMVWTPDGFAVHRGEGCAHERFNPIGCFHSKEYGRKHEMTQALVKAESILTPAPIAFDDEQMKVIKSTIAKGATDTELALFVSTCKRTGLDPFMRQIYAVKRYDSREKREVMAIQIGIDGQRLIAERTGKYGGQDPIEWLDVDGTWSEVWTGEGDFPVAARCSVYRLDWQGRKATAVCRWDSYAQYFGNPAKLGAMWDKMPDVMLGKCAESLALRKAFPAEMSAVAALAGHGYDPSMEPDGYAPDEDRTNAIEGSYAEVEEPESAEHNPITTATKNAIAEAYNKVREAVGQKPFMEGVRPEMQKQWPHAFKNTVNALDSLSEEEGFDVLAWLHDQMPPVHEEEPEDPE